LFEPEPFRRRAIEVAQTTEGARPFAAIAPVRPGHGGMAIQHKRQPQDPEIKDPRNTP
jgi:hypothetical protein